MLLSTDRRRRVVAISSIVAGNWRRGALWLNRLTCCYLLVSIHLVSFSFTTWCRYCLGSPFTQHCSQWQSRPRLANLYHIWDRSSPTSCYRLKFENWPKFGHWFCCCRYIFSPPNLRDRLSDRCQTLPVAACSMMSDPYSQMCVRNLRNLVSCQKFGGPKHQSFLEISDSLRLGRKFHKMLASDLRL